MRHMIFVMVCTALLSGCSNQGQAYYTLSEAQYTDIKATGIAPFECPFSDLYATRFVARNPDGKYVSGVVCGGMDKFNATIVVKQELTSQ